MSSVTLVAGVFAVLTSGKADVAMSGSAERGPGEAVGDEFDPQPVSINPSQIQRTALNRFIIGFPESCLTDRHLRRGSGMKILFRALVATGLQV